jgi:hypothetical protein
MRAERARLAYVALHARAPLLHLYLHPKSAMPTARCFSADARSLLHRPVAGDRR